MNEDAALLRRYLDEKSQAAFTEFVHRNIALVYGAALRRVCGNANLAQDVTQTVFTSAARKAALLAQRPVIAGWLFQATQFAAIDALRRENRRHTRELEARARAEICENPDVKWDTLRPLLEAAIGELRDTDRDVVMLRFFGGRTFPEIGRDLSLSENAARMRVERALEKLRSALARRGISSTAGAIATVLVTPAAIALPPGLVAAISSCALASAGGIVHDLGNRWEAGRS